MEHIYSTQMMSLLENYYQSICSKSIINVKVHLLALSQGKLVTTLLLISNTFSSIWGVKNAAEAKNIN